jgi:hypothetical protein
MLQEEVWIKRLANEIGADQSVSKQLWSAFVHTLESLLLEGQCIYIPKLGKWSLKFKEEFVVGNLKPTHLLPPSLRLSIEHTNLQDATRIDSFASKIIEQTNIDEYIVARWLSVIPKLTNDLLTAGQTVLYPSIAQFYLDAEGVHLSLDAQFRSKLNKAFSVFTPEEIVEGTDISGLEHIAVSYEEFDYNPPIIIPLEVETKVSESECTREEQEDEEKASQEYSQPDNTLPLSISAQPYEEEIVEDEISLSIEEENVTEESTKTHKSIIGITILLLILGLATTLYFVIKSQSKTIHTKQDIKTSVERPRQASTPHHKPQTQARDSVTHSSKEVSQKPPIEKATTELQAQAKKIELHAPEKEAASQTQVEQKKEDSSKHKGNVVTDSQANVPEEIEIGADQSLAAIAKRKYGHRAFWVYIYEENREHIHNPHNIPIGTRLSLPPAKKYNIDPNNTKSVEQALILSKSI